MFQKVLRGVAVVSTSILFATAACAGDPVSVLVIGDDGDPDALSRQSPAFDHLLTGIRRVVEAEGSTVYVEGDVTGSTGTSRASPRPPELVALAQALPSGPADVVTAVQFFTRAVANPETNEIALVMSVSGRMYRVPEGAHAGQYSVDIYPGDLPPVPADCDNSCILDFLNVRSEQVGEDVGRQLATRLSLVSPAE